MTSVRRGLFCALFACLLASGCGHKSSATGSPPKDQPKPEAKAPTDMTPKGTKLP
jgi:hypothetical protein